MRATENIFKPFDKVITTTGVQKIFVSFKDKCLVHIPPAIDKWDCAIKKQLDGEINNLIKNIVNFTEEINEKIAKLKANIKR